MIAGCRLSSFCMGMYDHMKRPSLRQTWRLSGHFSLNLRSTSGEDNVDGIPITEANYETSWRGSGEDAGQEQGRQENKPFLPPVLMGKERFKGTSTTSPSLILSAAPLGKLNVGLLSCKCPECRQLFCPAFYEDQTSQLHLQTTEMIATNFKRNKSILRGEMDVMEEYKYPGDKLDNRLDWNATQRHLNEVHIMTERYQRSFLPAATRTRHYLLINYHHFLLKIILSCFSNDQHLKTM